MWQYKGWFLLCFYCVLQETMMDNALRTISYIADIGNIVVLMARRRMPRTASQDCIETTPGAPEAKKQYKMICHVFESEDVSVFFNKKNCKKKSKIIIHSEKMNESIMCWYFWYHQHIQIWNLTVPKQTKNSKMALFVKQSSLTNGWWLRPSLYTVSYSWDSCRNIFFYHTV